MRGVDLVVKAFVVGSISVFFKESFNDNSLLSVLVLLVLIMVVADISKQR